jgi:hypothetical protein
MILCAKKWGRSGEPPANGNFFTRSYPQLSGFPLGCSPEQH